MEDQDESENNTNNAFDLDQSKHDEKFNHPVNITTENSVSILD